MFRSLELEFCIKAVREHVETEINRFTVRAGPPNLLRTITVNYSYSYSFLGKILYLMFLHSMPVMSSVIAIAKAYRLLFPSI